jgi:hypothetical protein
MIYGNHSDTGQTAWVTTAMEAPVVYISGPMTGYPDANYPAFHEAERHLRSIGCRVLNPARHFDGSLGLTRETYMRKDVEELLKATMLYMLEGWEESEGASLEHEIAKELGLAIVYQEPVVVNPACYPSMYGANRGVPSLTVGGVPPMDHDEFYNTYMAPPEPQPETTLQEAQRLIHGDRNLQYGHPLDDFGRTGRIIGAILGIPDVAAEKVGLILDAVKTSRAVNELDAGRPIKRDTLVDGPGYWGCIDMVQEERARRVA